MFVYSQPAIGVVGLADASISRGVVLNIQSLTDLGGYALDRAVGPISSPTPEFLGTSFPMNDSTHDGLDYFELAEIFVNVGGNVESYTSCPTCNNVTFTATMDTSPAPEPSMLLLVGTGLVGLMSVVRKKLA
jgi:hypothetical protein